jgi:hypothetical protein
MAVLLGRKPARYNSERSRCDEERPVSARERVAEGLHGAAIRDRGTLEVAGKRKVMLKREVDHRVGFGSHLAQGVEIVKGACFHLHPSGRQSGSRGIGASEADNLVPGVDELGYDS